MKHFTIPVFIPELACPNRCVFCNQNSISGCYEQPDLKEVEEIIESRLKTILTPKTNGNLNKVHIEIGFFGGNFTGIDEDLQRDYLSIAYKYLKEGQIDGIRLSTRPDYITVSSLNLLKEYGVNAIELGAQSLDDEVLKQAGRGHSVADIERAASLISEFGFELGLQMMTGLPGDTTEKSKATARKIVALGASCTRIYPTLVIKNTELEQLWLSGRYIPQSLDEAVILTAELLTIFEEGGVKVIRVGLHPSEDLVKGDDMLAGPFHVSFRQLAETELWRQKLQKLINNRPEGGNIVVKIPDNELNQAIGFNGSNRIMLEKHFKKVVFEQIQTVVDTRPIIIADKRTPLPAKNALKQLGTLTLIESDPSVYKAIAGHPDIFICQGNDAVVVSPSLPENIVQQLELRNYKINRGTALPGKTYPASAIYNAVVTDDLMIHNLKITDHTILEVFSSRKAVHVNQGYTRCNLLPLIRGFITSDRGIEKTLTVEGFNVLYVDPTPVVLKGHKHGFFPGCCGVMDDTILICGSLNYHSQAGELRDFIASAGMKVHELFDGKLTDVGSILVFRKQPLIHGVADTD